MLDGTTLSWIHLPTVDSTMAWVKRNCASLPENTLTIVYADVQTAGIGQHGRKWLSFANVGLYATLFFRVEKTFPFLPNLGQLLAISCVEVLQNFGFRPQMKWPNDLLLDQKKCGGVLVETITIEEEYGVSIGIGLNVNTTREQLDAVDLPATSLLESSHRAWKIEELLFPIVERFLANLQFLQGADFSFFAKKIQSVLAYLNEEVLFSDGQHSFTALCKGIDEKGRLELEKEDGTINHFWAGTIKKP